MNPAGLKILLAVALLAGLTGPADSVSGTVPAIDGTWLSGDGNGRWSGGTNYDPNSGKTYRCIVTVVDEETLKVRGYVGVPLLGRTAIWKRVKD